MDTKTVTNANLVGRLSVPDPNLPNAFATYNVDFSVAASIEFDFTVINQQQVLGVIKGMFIDNSSNPNEVTVSVSNTDQYFTVPAYAEGVFKIDAQINSRIKLETDGGASDQVTVTFYNREVAPSVWYRYGAINKDIALKMQGANASGSNLDTDTFNNPFPMAGRQADGTLTPILVDAQGKVGIDNLNVNIGAVFGPDAVGTAPTKPGILTAVLDSAGNVIDLSLDANGDLPVADDITHNKLDAIIAALGGSTNPTNGAASSVASTNVDTVILAANAARKGVTVFNDSTAILYLLLANAVSSNAVYTVQIAAGGYYEVPFGYTGIIKGVWSAVNGAARVTEIS